MFIGSSRQRGRAPLLAGISIFLGITAPAWADQSRSADTADCEVTDRSLGTNNPDLLVCGDFQGFTDLTKYKDQIVGATADGKLTVRRDIPLFANPLFTKVTQELGNCYYDYKSPKLTKPISVNALVTVQDKLVNLFTDQSTNSQLPQCASRRSIAGVCSGWVTCRGEKSQFHACPPSGQASCPPAEDCLTDKTFEAKREVSAQQGGPDPELAAPNGTASPYFPPGDAFGPWTIRNPAGQTTSVGIVRNFEKDNVDGTTGWFTRIAGCTTDKVQDANACFSDPCVKGIPASLSPYGAPVSNDGGSNASQPK